MASDNETVAEIREDVCEYLASIGPGEYPAETQVEEFADRFVAAHKREMDHRALIAGVSLADAVDDAHKRELAAKDDERLTIVANYENVIAAKDAEIAGLRRKLDLRDLYADEESEDADAARIVAEEETAAKDREIAELRGCLKEALLQRCNCNPDFKCEDCAYENEYCHKWRKALEGSTDEIK